MEVAAFVVWWKNYFDQTRSDQYPISPIGDERILKGISGGLKEFVRVFFGGQIVSLINSIGYGGRTCAIPQRRVGRGSDQLGTLIKPSPASYDRIFGVLSPCGQNSCVRNIVRGFIPVKSPCLRWVRPLGDGCWT